MSDAVYDTKTLKESNAKTFNSLGNKLQAPFLEALNDMGYEYMTPVQEKVLTQLPSNSSECLVQAKTGTGKTIAFLLPALQALLSANPLPIGQVGILIMSPTRELAIQIAKECDQLTKRLPKRVECHTAFGGTARASNLNKFLNGNPTVLVATPGRLKDYLTDEHVRGKFQNVRTLILDEADRMLDQGFLPDIKQVLRSLPPKSSGWQGMCFSATIPPTVKDVIGNVLKPGYVHMSTIDEGEAPTIATVPQYSVVVPEVKDTFTTLYALIKQECTANPKDFKTIIFGTTANGVALMHALFSQLACDILPDLKVYQLQSRLNQTARTRTTEEFKVATSGLMFASDVIGRGMDFPNVGLVIQVGLPMNGEQYIHRVGRTARAGNDGRAVILLTSSESYFMRANRSLPIKPYTIDLGPIAASQASVVESAFDRVDPAVKAKAYQAYLGFNKVFMKNLQTDSQGLVAMANDMASSMQCPEPPMVDKRIVGKMGFKGVKGLNVGHIERDMPPRRKPAANGNGNANGGGKIVKPNEGTSFGGPARGGGGFGGERNDQAGSGGGRGGGNGQGRRGGFGQKRRGGAPGDERAMKR
ncbi:P-loop containing nucleoside triphosphate hydrolase protein [Tothia fuscella]|uniref:ATP-dependent RNA helicase n=1 Tax=Tothia fuscella TaxID=1048955 RepID=A0A9P4NJN9_9PEZI|nr:P-loop containing nucleoside triphosphate hydrolase protein [Tothia fuscella]